MTTDEMRDAISLVFVDALGKAGISASSESVPEGVTPQTWDMAIPLEAQDLDAEDFRTRYAEPIGAVLAAAGMLQYGCNSFGRLNVIDRPEAKVRGQRGLGIIRKRDRAFIVHAVGWKA